MFLKMRYVAATLLTASSVVCAQVEIDQPWVRGTVEGQKATGAFMTLHAHERSRLVSVSSPVASVAEIHEMKMVEGVMKMRAVPALDLPRMTDVELKPGGYHIMLMGLRQPLKAGDTVPMTLRFESQDKKPFITELKVPVRELTGSASRHGNHHKH